MTPVRLHLSLPLTEIHDLRLAAGCLSEISGHVVLMPLGPAHDRHDAVGPRCFENRGNPGRCHSSSDIALGPCSDYPRELTKRKRGSGGSILPFILFYSIFIKILIFPGPARSHY